MFDFLFKCRLFGDDAEQTGGQIAQAMKQVVTYLWRSRRLSWSMSSTHDRTMACRSRLACTQVGGRLASS